MLLYKAEEIPEFAGNGIKRCRRRCSTALKSEIDQLHKILERHTVSTDSVSSFER